VVLVKCRISRHVSPCVITASEWGLNSSFLYLKESDSQKAFDAVHESLDAKAG
jgi:hypothetical protein